MPKILLAVGLLAGCILVVSHSFLAEGKPGADPVTGAVDMRGLKGVLLVTLVFAYLLESGLGGQVFVNTLRKFKPKPDETVAPRFGLYEN